MKDLRRDPRRSGASVADGSLNREVSARAGAAVTKPGRPSTARWVGSGERDAEVYARNRRLRPVMSHRLEPGGSGPDAARTHSLNGERGTLGQVCWCRPGRPR